ncbi:TetR/AcrR family transcriptional regulator [Ruegeria pomeroyi]|jgi:AcrR family transcriptional regulator|nr:TetR/AcrR family transcriptional regulator [Ruegeria pomeroyi]
MYVSQDIAMPRAARLSAERWVEIGLETLAQEGYVALKADQLSRAQGVTRGSFYYHFENVADFHAAVIARWKHVATNQVIAGLLDQADPRKALESLFRTAFGHPESLEWPMRFWAENEALARAAIDEIDTRRIGFLEQLLGAIGHAPPIARRKAQLIYDCYLGSSLRRRLNPAELDGLVAELLQLAGTPATGDW